MRSSFFEYHVASSGLFAARGGLETVSHNLANAATPGYSRQVAELRASRPLANYGRGMVGTGAEQYEVNQVRNFYLDKKYWSETGTLGEYNQKFTQLQITETLLNEVGANGINTQMTAFFNSLKDLTENSASETYRTNVISLLNSMTTYFSSTYTSLQKQQKDIDDEIVAMVNRINSLGNQITNMNKRITEYELNGDRANDLRDERARLVDELSQFVNITVEEEEMNPDYALGKYPNPEDRNKSHKEFRVYINGQLFVNHHSSRNLEARQRKQVIGGEMTELYNNPEDVSGLHDIYWQYSDKEFNIHHPNLSGELKALVDIRDGNNGNYIEKKGSEISYEPTNNQLTFTLDKAERKDLHQAGGRIKVITDTGLEISLDYTAFSYDDSTGEATFTLSTEKSPSEYDTLLNNNTRSLSIGKSSGYKGIPHYLQRLNTMVRTLAMAFNEGKHMDGTDISGVIGHVDGYNLDGENLSTLLFTYTDENGNEADFSNFNIYNLGVENFVVNKDLIKDPRLLACGKDETTGVDDNRVILGFLEIEKTNSLFKEGNLHDYIASMTIELGIDVEQAELFSKNYTEVITTIDNQRKSISGVSENEEIINMIAFQTQYRAAARLMTVIDGIYDQTINNMGLI